MKKDNWLFNGKLEKGMYQTAADNGMPFFRWLEEQRAQKIGPTPYYGMSFVDIWRYRKKMRAQGKLFPLTAFEEQLKFFDIHAVGSITDVVGKFFRTSDTSVLFPEYVSTQVYYGLLQMGLTQEFIQDWTVIQGHDYRKVYLQDSEDERELAKANASGEFPSVEVTVSKQTIHLEKYGKQFIFDYEEIKDTPLNLYGAQLMRVGEQIAISETDDMVYVLINGDGNSNGLESAQTKTTETSGAIERKDVIKLAMALPKPYSLDKFLGRKAYGVEYNDALASMTNPSAQWGITTLILPQFFEWDRPVVTSDRFYGVDSKRTLGYVTNDTMVLTETDKLIGKQKQRYVVSKRSSIHVIDQDGIGCLDIEH